jgi:hypothetical protein
MDEMKVEHVLLFLVGAFLVYHMMGKCRRVENFGLTDKGYPRCDQMRRYSPTRKKCSEIPKGDCEKTFQPDSWVGAEQILCQWDEGRGICTTSAEHCSDW